MCNLCKYNNGEYKSLCLDCKKEQDKILKVVKTVLDDNSKEIEYGQISNSQIIEKINMELLKEEIKNAMEKGKE